MREVAPTRSAALDLADERRLMRQGYEFLDEKRVLLATEMLRQLRAYRDLSEQAAAELKIAADALAAAVERHGLDNLQVYPVPPLPPSIPAGDRKPFLGVGLLTAGAFAAAAGDAPQAIDPSPEARACRAAFERLLRSAAETGVRAGNLYRLAREYRRTERRAKALENVLLPEVEEALKRLDELLDTLDREDAIRARWSKGEEERP
ncbi:MAG TPA: V-type ATP synthase subunit D [Stellaceae bacterium]|nr:V-type ATP synthase subunit D [Stellaceae bacterium]